MRINKFLAQAGVASRRKAEEIVLLGKVKVNGKVVTSLAFDVDEESSIVEVEGQTVKCAEKFIYLAFHKPKGCVCTASDEHGRKTIFDFLTEKQKKQRLFSVGRLDYNTEGLIILTNDGDTANKLMHPKSQVAKKYVANIKGAITESELDKLRKGIKLDDGYVTAPARASRISFKNEVSRVELLIAEGKNRQVRRMFEALGKEVDFLVRKSIGEINLGGLARAKARELTPKEINYLKKI